MPKPRKQPANKRHMGKKSHKPAPTTKVLATRIKKLENTIETNYKDVYNVLSPDVSGGGVPLVISLLPQGDDFNERKGEVVTLRKAHFNVNLTHASAVTAPSIFRMIVFWDLQTNGQGFVPFITTGLPVEALIDDTVIVDKMLAPLNERTKQRYKVLMDKTYVLNTIYTGLANSINIQKTFSLSNAKQQYSSSGGNIGNCPARTLCYYLYSNRADTQTTAVRFWYKDA